jgi:hypothetical protein
MQSQDWNDRKTAAEALQMMAQLQSLEGAISVYREGAIELLGRCKFDKVIGYHFLFWVLTIGMV